MAQALAQLSFLFRHAVLRFAGVGVVNTLLTLAIIFGLKAFFGVSDPIANLAGYAVGLACSFMLNKRWTFRHRTAALPALGRFLLVFGASYLINIVIVLAFIRFGLNDYLAHLAGMPFYTVVFYVGCKEYAFASGAGRSRVFADESAIPHWREWCVATLVLLAVVLFYRLGASPLEIWDEARLANNAVEMAQNGWSLITTYEGLPDHWNTKPPLLIWIMALLIHFLGVNEWAVRLPSAVATLATGSLVFGFCCVRLKRPFIGFAAALVMLSMPGYIMYHGARAGDYDAMLTLWTTAYILAGYMFVHAPLERRTLWLSLCSTCIALAFLTKTVQGLVFLPVLLAYIGLSGRLVEALRTRAFYINAAMVLAICIGYYLAREQVDPGYFAAVRDNDLGGRYASVIEGHQGGVFWYLQLYNLFPWLIPGLAASVWLVWRGQEEQRRVAFFLLLMAAFYLAVISTASTKLFWYAIPLCPLVAIPAAMAGERALGYLLDRFDTRKSVVILIVCAVAAGAVTARNIVLVERQIHAKSVDEYDRYSAFLRSNAIEAGKRLNLVVIHPGYPNAQGDPFYVATTLFYASGLRSAGHTVAVQPVSQEINPQTTSVAVCGERLLGQVAASVRLEPVSVRGDCGIYAIIKP